LPRKFLNFDFFNKSHATNSIRDECCCQYQTSLDANKTLFKQKNEIPVYTEIQRGEDLFDIRKKKKQKKKGKDINIRPVLFYLVTLKSPRQLTKKKKQKIKKNFYVFYILNAVARTSFFFFLLLLLLIKKGTKSRGYISFFFFFLNSVCVCGTPFLLVGSVQFSPDSRRLSTNQKRVKGKEPNGVARLKSLPFLHRVVVVGLLFAIGRRRHWRRLLRVPKT
jgi:hypothetical protein